MFEKPKGTNQELLNPEWEFVLIFKPAHLNPPKVSLQL